MKRAIRKILNERHGADSAKTALIQVASQHQLVDGIYPGKEFKQRLDYARRIADCFRILDANVEFLVVGSRHREGKQHDQIALYDAGARWLVEHSESPEAIHGLDWLKKGETVYNGAEELRVAARGLRKNPKFYLANYICSPGQAERAERYAHKAGFLGKVIPMSVENLPPEEQFHGNTREQNKLKVLSYVDPGDLVLGFIARHHPSQSRVPTDGHGPGTLEALIPEYRDLGITWYQQPAAA